MLYLTNTFTLGMLENAQGVFSYKRISLDEAREKVKNNGYISAVGHQATAQLMSILLGVDVPYNRIQIKTNAGDEILVCQILVRLEEGRVLTLDEMIDLYNQNKISFYLVEVAQ